MKKYIFMAFILSFMLAKTPFAETVYNLDEVISQFENEKVQEPSEDEKARDYMIKTIKSAKKTDDKTSMAIVSYLAFEHRFLYGYPTFCQKHNVDLNNFKETYKTANNDIRNKIALILKANPDLKKMTSDLFNDKKTINTENSNIEDEFKQIEMSGFSADEMCDIFNSKSPKDDDINYKTLFKEIASEILKYDENIPLNIK